MRAAERKAAKLAGEVRYSTGKPCKQGHLADRFTRNGECVTCAEARWEKDAAERPERVKARWTKYRLTHRDVCRARTIAWRAQNAAHISAYNKRVRQEKPEFFRPYCAERRAKLAGSDGKFTHEDVERIKKSQRGKCAGCRCRLGRGFHRDHIIPLSLGGSNKASNIQLLCAPCNLSKNAKHPVRWAQERGMLL